jgi:hypothetical protein
MEYFHEKIRGQNISRYSPSKQDPTARMVDFKTLHFWRTISDNYLRPFFSHFWPNSANVRPPIFPANYFFLTVIFRPPDMGDDGVNG